MLGNTGVMPDARGSQRGKRPRRNGEAGSKPRRPPWAISGVILIRLVTSQAFLIALVVWSFMWVTVGASWAPPLFIVAVIALAIRRGLNERRQGRPGAESARRSPRRSPRPRRVRDHRDLDDDWDPDELGSEDWDAGDEWDEIEDHWDDDWDDRPRSRPRGHWTRRPAWWNDADDDDDVDDGWDDDEVSRRPRRRHRSDSWASDAWDDDDYI